MNNKCRHIKKLDDADIIKEYQVSKDRKCVGVLFERYAPLVFGVCLKYLKNKEDSEDALHNIFEKIFHLLTENNIEKFDAWLYSVTKNYCLMQLRKKQKIQAYSFDDGIVSGEEQEEENTENKYFSLLRKHLKKLKKEQALCLELFYFEKKSYKDIAILTSLDVKDIKSHIQNGKRMLKNLFLKEEKNK
jgi:RNA polymerase sigma-70 factor (ECF subfamily)